MMNDDYLDDLVLMGFETAEPGRFTF